MDLVWDIAAAAACVTAGVGAALAAAGWLDRRTRTARLREEARENAIQAFSSKGTEARLLQGMCQLDRKLQMKAARPLVPKARAFSEPRWFNQALVQAGLAGRLGYSGFREYRLRLTMAAAAACGAVGAVFSAELCTLGVLGGGLAGFLLPRWALGQERSQRAASLTSELPQMLEVAALGMRSGLSFDSSFGLYSSHFSTAFAHSCSMAQTQWTMGLKTREEALRDLAATYDSQALGHVVDAMVRSLRLGTQLADALEREAAQARETCKAQRQEQVAKAPVKMMIPTGTLILPAMLLMVLGPVMLELMEGF